MTPPRTVTSPYKMPFARESSAAYSIPRQYMDPAPSGPTATDVFLASTIAGSENRNRGRCSAYASRIKLAIISTSRLTRSVRCSRTIPRPGSLLTKR